MLLSGTVCFFRRKSIMMTMILNCRMFALSAMAVAMLASNAPTFAAKDAVDGGHAAHMLKCAKVCADCQVQCDACFTHCASLVSEGKKEHAKCMNNCVDCAECCKLCATLCARQSSFSAAAAECCAKCCDECATACEKISGDETMIACAKTCRTCAKECRDMMKMMK